MEDCNTVVDERCRHLGLIEHNLETGVSVCMDCKAVITFADHPMHEVPEKEKCRHLGLVEYYNGEYICLDCKGVIPNPTTISNYRVDVPERERGVKHDQNKPQMSLLPLKDLEGVVRVLEFGMKKYARGDWKFVDNGAFRYVDAGLRHVADLTDPTSIEDLRHLDPESGLPTIDHAICSLIFARHFIFKDMETPDAK